MAIDHLAHLRADCDAVLAVLAVGDPNAPVAACPGWDLRALVEHLGCVHRWAAEVVRTGVVADQPTADGVDDLAGWFADGADALLTALTAADPQAPTWSFTTDRTAGFWRRRQALETVVHRWDAQRAVGEPAPLDAQLAADGIAEVADLFLPRQVRFGRIPPLPAAVALRPLDAGPEVRLGDGQLVATVTGPAEVLLLLLWHRVGPADPRLSIDGDADAARSVLALALAP